MVAIYCLQILPQTQENFQVGMLEARVPIVSCSKFSAAKYLSYKNLN